MMNAKTRSTERLAVLGVLTLLGSQVQAGLLPACTQAEVDMQAEELQVDGNFQWCYRPSVWLGQADGSYENLGTPLYSSDDSVVADLTDATVVVGATQKVVVKCCRRPRCQIDVAFGYPAPVARTGQTETVPLDPAPDGSDGALQKGVAWPVPRFTDNGDGTVTDNLTGLILLRNANCFGLQTWANALAKANALNDGCTDCGTDGDCDLSDGSTAGEWRLPNIKELLSLVGYGFKNPALPNTEGTEKWTEGKPFSGVQSYYYWSSTADAVNTSFAWVLGLDYGYVGGDDKSHGGYVWPVRGGQ